MTFDRTKSFALAVGQLLERVHPELVLTEMTKAKRDGKVFIDWSQNHLTKTTVAAYSLRARPNPTVSTPVTWDEVSDTADSGDTLVFRYDQTAARVADMGDLFGPVLELVQELPELG
jgi:bifunctional non-homologous end joining protein LigD